MVSRHLLDSVLNLHVDRCDDLQAAAIYHVGAVTLFQLFSHIEHPVGSLHIDRGWRDLEALLLGGKSLFGRDVPLKIQTVKDHLLALLS